MSELREVVLHGELARRFGKHHQLAVSSAAEAVRALAANHKGFEQHLVESQDRGVGYQVWVNGENVGEDELKRHSGGRIYISPVVMGSKRAGALQTIIGAVLVVVGVIVNVYAPGAGTPLIEAGVAMMIGGVIQMLAGVPKSNQDQNRLQSSFFDGPVNTIAAGNPVPIGYGELIVGSAVISAGISIDDESPNGDGSSGSGNGSWRNNQGVWVYAP